jgi:hypothetical protein
MNVRIDVVLMALLLGDAGAPARAATSGRPTPTCHGVGYASDKIKGTEFDRPRSSRMGDDSTRNDGSILLTGRRLEEPPEITRIRRGLVHHFAGGEMSAGLEMWHAIDLDRGLVLSVDRYLRFRGGLTFAPKGDPILTRRLGKDEHLFARKYTSSRGDTEVEVVATRPVALDGREMEDFVCKSNAEWVDRGPVPHYAAFSGTTDDDATTEAYLLDETSDAKDRTSYRLTVDYLRSPSLGAVLELAQQTPHHQWKKTSP